jgi:hypothetical protein
MFALILTLAVQPRDPSAKQSLAGFLSTPATDEVSSGFRRLPRPSFGNQIHRAAPTLYAYSFARSLSWG